ncbi:MAG: aminopeptidase, partial [Candidatus Hydrothermarchaeota archaeon]|nr:aminopeptidase [Candidatus Hydrothermarchaeota archaeon]
AGAMLGSDVVIMPTTMSLSHTDARKKTCDAGGRVASMPGITTAMLENGGLHTNYGEMRKLTERIVEIGSKAEKIKITSSPGCDFTASIGGRKMIPDTGFLHTKGSFGNLPAGEAFVAPVEGSSEGKLVFDGSFGGVGVLKEPVELEVRGGGAVRCTNAKLSKLIRTCRNADNIAEIGIGTNSAAKIIGNVLEDEKVHGTCHVAIGDNHAFGGKTIAEVHLDGIIKKPNIFLDGVAVVRDGEFLLGRV